MTEQGMIYDIVHGSFVDGPGVRTTVFFKGCNLKCRWCHNPESQSVAPEMLFYRNKCTACGECKNMCPNSLLDCDLCGECVKYCSVNARKVCGKMLYINEVMDEILRDEMFYRQSEGGVTFSGGECMLQIEFLTELLKQCQKAGVHTAVDTAGNVPWEYFEKLLPCTNVFLYDVKCFSEKLHREGTGISNEKILDNLQRLSGCFEGEIIIRIPIITGFNSDEAELKKTADFLRGIRYSKIELLPYHKLGENKYLALNKDIPLYSIPSKSEMEKAEEIFELKI